MMRRITAAAIAALALVALVGPATASANVPSYTARTNAANIARAYWHTRGESNVCLQGIEIKTHRMRSWPAGTLGYVSTIGGGKTGFCTVHLNSAWSWNAKKVCVVTIHEIGHRLGYRHTAMSASIMSPRVPNPVWGWDFPACSGRAPSAPVPAPPPAPVPQPAPAPAPSFDWAAFNACMNRNNQRFNDWLAADQAWMNQQIANGGLWDYSTKPPLPASEKCV